ncbi:MAG: methyl-accepting chemotaxis protein [Gammaproteobacteria bacterium]|nr:methyl-accepting chemotaxis protein [Gammaproteobacteria bacterium]
MHARLSINQKIWAGLCLNLAILVTISSQALFSFHRTERALDEVVGQIQPLVVDVLHLRYEFEELSEELGLFLLTEEPQYRDEYLEISLKLARRLEDYPSHPLIREDHDAQLVAEKLLADFDRHRQLADQLLPLATDADLKYPGVAVATAQLNPIGENLRTLAGEMVNAVRDEEVDAHLARHVEDIRYLWANVMLQVRGFIWYRDQASAANLATYLDHLPQAIEAVRRRTDLPLTLENAITQFAAQFDAFLPPLRRMQSLHQSDEWRRDALLLRRDLAPIHRDVSDGFETLVNRLQRRAATSSSSALDQADLGRTLVSILGVGAVVIGVFMAWRISRLFRHRVLRAVEAMQEIAEGDGNLARRLDDSGHDEITQLGVAFNKFVGKINGVVDMVTATSKNLSDEAASMSTITAKTREGAENQQAEINEVTRAVEQMVVAVDAVAGDTQAAAVSAREAAARSASGRERVDAVTNEIEELARDVVCVADSMAELQQESDSIDAVVNLIREIAEQTNLLALNAAIEAARAGEQGRGFAVVADEVRNLANRTHSGTDEIRVRIERLQQRSRDAATAIEKGNARVQHSVEQAREARGALVSINDAVEQIDRLNERIADAAARQSGLSKDISTKVLVINDIAGVTAVDARKTSASSHELKLLAAQMEGLVVDFLLKGHRDQAPAAMTGMTPDASPTDNVELF